MEKEDSPRSEGPPEPYHVLKRHRGIGGGLGRLYETRNDETGHAALVLVPGPKGDLRPTEDWQVRLTSNVTPPYLALEVEHAPTNGQPRQLSWMLDRWATTLARIAERPETQAHLTAGARKPPSPPEGTRPRSLAAGVAMAALLTLGVTPEPQPTPAPVSPIAPPELVMDSPEPFTSLFTDATQVIGLPMPQKPFKGQNHPPCKSRYEVVIRGGCWVEIAARPPCEEAYELEGKCYLPGYSTPRPPQALNP